MNASRLGRAVLGAAVLVAGWVVLAAAQEPASKPLAALAAGNDLYREGRLEEAAVAYRRGWDPDRPHPTLVYNLGTTLHHLDRLPEAILWYRRAAGSADPWLDENLWLARRTLGTQTLDPGGAIGLISRLARPLRIAAIVLAWAALLAWIGFPRLPVAPLAAAGALALLLWGSALAAARWGPRPIVVLADCATAGGDLPAGTEAWATAAADGAWLLSGTADARCPRESAEAVFP